MPEIASLAEAIRRWSLEVTGAAPITVACSQQHTLEMVGHLLSHGHVLRRQRAITPPSGGNLGHLGGRVKGPDSGFPPDTQPPTVTGSPWRPLAQVGAFAVACPRPIHRRQGEADAPGSKACQVQG